MRILSIWGAAVATAFFLSGCGESQPAVAQVAADSLCAGCHSAQGEPPPFRDQTGSTDTVRLTVGAHDAHLHGDLAAPMSCGQCHKVPQGVSDPGHMDAPPNEVVQFGPLARTGGASPMYVATGCVATYCHGNFPGGNTTNTPHWLGGAADGQCGTCHGIPPSTGHHSAHVGQPNITCPTCHGDLLQATHVDGVKTMALPAWNPATRSCAQACHEPRNWDG